MPALAAARLHPKIYAGDLGWGPNHGGYLRTDIFGPSRGALAGVSWHHGYFGAPGVMSALRRVAPRLDEIVDECSPGLITPTPTSEIVIASLRNWASTVALWNLALDPTGGLVQPPNHGCPGCVGLARIDERSGAVSLTRAYYQLGQASAFIAPGARRIAATHFFVSYAYPRSGVNVVTPGLDDVAVRNPDGSIVLVAYDNAPVTVRFAVRAGAGANCATRWPPGRWPRLRGTGPDRCPAAAPEGHERLRGGNVSPTSPESGCMRDCGALREAHLRYAKHSQRGSG